MSQYGWYGVWLLVGSSAAVVIELAVIGIWGMRLGRRARALTQQLQMQQELIQSDLERVRTLMEETRVLWRPYGRVIRWLRHPLVVALIGSYRGRWAAR
ncbi:MAG TPA: hypothetical protein VKT20_09530 [Candidatus Dormibacteraeota bacterium]|nr:hypothetical protein [Candidatus Dormibacteraeota bacterium]